LLGFLRVLAEVVFGRIRESMWLNGLCNSGRGIRLAAPLALFGPSSSLPAAPALLLLLVFAVPNRALVILKRRELAGAGHSWSLAAGLRRKLRDPTAIGNRLATVTG